MPETEAVKLTLQALRARFELLKGKLEKCRSDEECVKTTAECRHVMYAWKIKAAGTVAEKVAMLAEYLGEEMPQKGSNEERTQKLFQRYLDNCQKITRCYVWKHGPPDKMDACDLESFIGIYGKEIDQDTFFTEDEVKQLVKAIVDNKTDRGGDYEAFCEFLSDQVFPYVECHVNGATAVEWPELRTDLRVNDEHDTEVEQAGSEVRAALEVKLRVESAQPVLTECEGGFSIE